MKNERDLQIEDGRIRFPDGDPVTPFVAPEDDRPHGALGIVVLLIILAITFFVTTILTADAAEADVAVEEPSEVIYSHADRENTLECVIDTALRVRGNRRAACVEKLETAARLAKAEQKVNERKKR